MDYTTIHRLHRVPPRFSYSPKRQRGEGFTGQPVPALTLGAMCPPRKYGQSNTVCGLPLCGAGWHPQISSAELVGQVGNLRPIVNRPSLTREASPMTWRDQLRAGVVIPA